MDFKATLVKIVLLPFLLIVLLVILGGGLISVVTLGTTLWHAGWSHQTGRITFSNLTEIKNQQGSSFENQLKYQYSRDGKTFQGNYVSTSSDYPTAYNLEQKNQVGNSIELVVNPLNPSESLLAQNQFNEFWIFLITSPLLLLSAALVFGGASWIKQRLTPSTKPLSSNTEFRSNTVQTWQPSSLNAQSSLAKPNQKIKHPKALILIGLLFMLATVFPIYQQAFEVKNWVPWKATVIKTYVTEEHSRHSTYYKGNIVYNYSIYTNRYYLGTCCKNLNFDNSQAAQSVLNTFPPGTLLQIFVNPNDASQSTFSPEFDFDWGLVMLFFLGLILLVVGVYHVLKNKANPQESEQDRARLSSVSDEKTTRTHEGFD